MFQTKVTDINETTAKTATKTWLAKVTAIFIHRTRLTYNSVCNMTLNEDYLSILNSILRLCCML